MNVERNHPCTCNNPINLETDSLCPACEEILETYDNAEEHFDAGPEPDFDKFSDGYGDFEI